MDKPKTYLQLSRATFYEPVIKAYQQRNSLVVDDMTIHDTNVGEIVVSWHMLHNHRRPVPQLHMFSDSWSWFDTYPEFFQALTDNPNIQPDELTSILEDMGFVEDAEYVDQHAET